LFEFEEGVKLIVDRVPGTNNDACEVHATSTVAAIKGLCWLVENMATYMNMTVEEVICRLAVTMLGPRKEQRHGKTD
jgi:hypothetical protein